MENNSAVPSAEATDKTAPGIPGAADPGTGALGSMRARSMICSKMEPQALGTPRVSSQAEAVS